MKTRTPLALALALALLAAACGGDDDPSPSTSGPPTTSSDLAGTSWEANEIYVDGNPIGIVAGSRVTLEVSADGAVGGTTGCNSYFGEAVITPGGIAIGQMGMTEIGCGEPLNTQENRVVTILQTADRWAIEGGVLSIGASDGSGGIDFVAPSPVVDALIEGTEWVLDTLIDGDAASTPVRGAEATIRFTAVDFSGNTGCNDFGGEVVLAPPEISVENMAWTEQGCEGPVMDQEALVLGVLQAATSIEVQGDRLTITDDTGRGLVCLAAP